MSAYLDIIGGTIIGAFLMLIALGASEMGTRQMFNYNAEEILQSNLSRMAQIINYDLGKMGFGVPDSSLDETVNIKADDELKYLAQLNMTQQTYYSETGMGTFDRLVDTVSYKIENGITFTIADSTIQLYDIRRTVSMNGGPTNSMVIGTVSNNNVFFYYDQVGSIAATPQEVRMVEVNLTALNPNVMLTPDLVSADINLIKNRAFREQELRRVLRPAYWSTRRLTARNMRR